MHTHTHSHVHMDSDTHTHDTHADTHTNTHTPGCFHQRSTASFSLMIKIGALINQQVDNIIVPFPTSQCQWRVVVTTRRQVTLHTVVQ